MIGPHVHMGPIEISFSDLYGIDRFDASKPIIVSGQLSAVGLPSLRVVSVVWLILLQQSCVPLTEPDS